MKPLNLSINLGSHTIHMSQCGEEDVEIMILDLVADEEYFVTLPDHKARTFMVDAFNNGSMAVEELLVNEGVV